MEDLMKDNIIHITVSGVAGSGKSRILYLIKETLREKGFIVEFDGGIDFDNGGDFDLVISQEIDDDVLHIIANKSKIVIEEKQQKRNKG